jgi:ketosteroid isomerase-like protein
VRRNEEDSTLNRRQFLSSIASLLLLASAPAQVQASDVREVVMDITQQACKAFRTGDLATVERLLAPEFTLVSSDSTVQTRSEVVAEVRSGEPKYEIFRNHSMVAHVFDDAAIVQGITSLKGTSNGQPFAVDVRFTDTLIRRKGQWQLVVSHVTRIPSK